MARLRLTRELKDRALKDGFDVVGVAAANRLERDEVTLTRWLAAGRHAEMTWMSREPEKRADPRRLLPGCKSVVMLAMNYGSANEAPPAPTDGKVARYARGRDYHKVLGRRLRRLVRWLEEASGEAARSFVDTGPVLERAWAERAGMGWIGKNSNLLTRDRGSWLMLGEILSAAELEPDAGPHEDFCGSCNACIEACPTAAIVADGVVDAERCISYWTIEHRGSVPVERREGNADWIFGCDICQEVCPWNRSFGHSSPGDLFEHREDLESLDPAEILGLDETEFRARYSGTALMRAKWEGMRRNACIVLGNGGAADALPVLGTVLGDEDAVIRSHAAWAVGRIGGEKGAAMLRRALREEQDPVVRAEIERDLCHLVGQNRMP